MKEHIAEEDCGDMRVGCSIYKKLEHERQILSSVIYDRRRILMLVSFCFLSAQVRRVDDDDPVAHEVPAHEVGFAFFP